MDCRDVKKAEFAELVYDLAHLCSDETAYLGEVIDWMRENLAPTDVFPQLKGIVAEDFREELK